jgi:hypothetical protein
VTLGVRVLIYIGCLLAVTAGITYHAISTSIAMLEHDKSAMAWAGFLPFIIPIFAMHAAVYVAPVAVVVEIILAVWRRSQ